MAVSPYVWGRILEEKIRAAPREGVYNSIFGGTSVFSQIKNFKDLNA